MSDAAFTELNVDIHWKRLAAFRTKLGVYRLPMLVQGNQEPLRVFFLKATGQDQSPFDVQDWNGDALVVGINTTALTGSSTETSLALQDTWDWNSTLECFEGELDLSGAAIDNYLGAEDALDVILEIRVTHAAGGRKTYLHDKVALKATAIELSAATPPPGHTYATRGENDQLYAKRVGLPGERQRWTSPGNLYAVERIVNDDGSYQDDVVDLA